MARARQQWLKSLLEICRNLKDDNGRQKYYVRRGTIDWANFNWPMPYALSVRAPENFPARGANPRETTLSINVATQIESSGVKETLYDDLLDQMEDDVHKALAALCKATLANNDSLILHSSSQGSVEWHSHDFSVQGFVVTFSIQF